MAKQLNVDINFRANNTEAVKKQVLDLQHSLSKIALGNIVGVDSTQLKAASTAAKELSIHLNNAYNANTGKLDLSKLNRSLATANTDIKSLTASLLQVGPSGQQAFIKLAQSIAAADRPLITINSRLKEMGTVLKNTVKWQISSSVIHGFMGAIRTSYRYAQDLNESLNNIRIVTGQSVEEMARFAEQANKSAKALSTTTTAYTNAALIYYQQGDSTAEVIEKANVTVKMANVVGESAKTVSNQLTAIWNNFDDGTKSLEYYADVLTALGAKTASSTDEIAEGMEKFAAIAETVGLSYEYSAAALATVTATTRQSADVVGNAFKTLFARIQGLNLGETLDDGTTLNKYSAALAKVGINIKDQSGELKEMDTILDEMGSKWEKLNKDQQVALAQAVAGVRQYSQLMALMNNWDFMKDNLNTARGSEGTLQEQADIYAESWQAASKKVQASLEAIYSDVIDDQFFINLAKGFSSLLNSLDAFIDGAGGIKTIFIAIGSAFMSSVANKIQPALNNLRHSFNVVFQGAQGQAKATAQEMNQSIEALLSKNQKDQTLSFANEQTLINAKALNEMKAQLLTTQKNLTDAEKQQYEQEIAILEIYQQQALEKATLADQHKTAALRSIQLNDTQDFTRTDGFYTHGMDIANFELQSQAIYDSLTNQLANYKMGVGEAKFATIQFTESLAELNAINLDQSSELQPMREKLLDIAHQARDSAGGMVKFNDVVKEINGAQNIDQLKLAFDKLKAQLQDSKVEFKDIEELLKVINGANFDNFIKYVKAGTGAIRGMRLEAGNMNRALASFNPTHVVTGIEKITKVAASLGQTAMVIQSLRSMFQAWQNDDLSIGEKITTSLMSISMLVPGLVGIFNNLTTALNISALAEEALAARIVATNQANIGSIASIQAKVLAEKTKMSVDQADIILTKAKILALKQQNAANVQIANTLSTVQVAKALNITMDKAEILVKKLQAGETWAVAAAEAGLDTVRKKGIISTLAATAAQLGFNTALGITLFIVGALMLALAALVAVIAGVSAGIKALSDLYNADAIAAERAAEASKKLKEAADEAKTSLDNIVSDVDKYNELIDKLESCTKGTSDWNDALRNVNDQIVTMLQNYPEMAKMEGLFNDDGTLNQKALDLAITQQQQKVDGLNAATSMATGKAQSLQAQAEITGVSRSSEDLSGSTIWDDVRKGMDIGAKVGNTTLGFGFGSFVGTIEGGLLGLAQGLLNNYLENIQFEEVINSLVADYETYGDAILDSAKIAEKFGLNWDELNGTQQEYIETVKKAVIDKLDAGRAIDNNIMAITQDWVSNHEEYKDFFDANGAGLALLAEEYQKKYDKHYEEYLELGRSYTRAQNPDEVRELAEEYLYYSDQKDLKINSSNLIQGNKQNRKIGFIDTSGEKDEKKAIEIEEIASVVAGAKALEELGDSAPDVKAFLGKLSAGGIDFLGKGLTGGTSASALADYFATMSVEQFRGLEPDAFKDKNGTYDIGKIEAALGLNKGEFVALATKFNIDTATLAKNLSAAYGDISSVVGDLRENDIEGASIAIQNELKSNRENLKESEAGKAIIKQYGKSLFGDLEKNINHQNIPALNEFYTALSQMDIYSENAAMQIRTLADSLGLSGQPIEKLIAQVQALPHTFNTATNDIITQRNTLKEIVGDDGLALGDTITEEQLKLLEEAGINTSTYFSKNAEGTYTLIGLAEEFNAAVNGITISALSDQVTDYKTAMAMAVDEGEWDSEDLKYSTDVKARRRIFDSSYLGEDDNSQTKLAQTRLNYISKFDDATRAEMGFSGDQELLLEKYNKSGGDMTFSPEELQEVASMLDIVNSKMYETSSILASITTSQSELNALKEQGLITEQEYAANMERIQIANLDEDADPEVYSNLKDHLDSISESSKELSEQLKDNEQALGDVAEAILRFDDAIVTVQENYQDWMDALSSGSAQDIAEVMEPLSETYGDLLDMDPSAFSADFLTDTENLERMKEAAEGSTEAYEDLQDAAKEDIEAQFNLDTTQFEEQLTTINDYLDSAEFQDLTVGASIDNTDFLTALSEMVNQAGMTAEQATNYLSSMGVDAEIEEHTEPQTITKNDLIADTSQTKTVSIPIVAADGSVSNVSVEVPDIKYKAVPQQYEDTFSAPTLEVTSARKSSGGNFKFKHASNGGGSKGKKKGGGGGSGGSKLKDPKYNKNEIERYHEIKNTIEDLSREYDRLKKARERAYGMTAVKYIEQEIEKTKELAEAQKQYMTEINDNLVDDRKALEALGATFDERGNVNNYDSLVAGWVKEFNAVRTEEAEEAYQDKIDALEQYEETHDLWEDEYDKLIDYYNQIVDLSLEAVKIEVEFKIKLSEKDIKRIEWQIAKLTASRTLNIDLQINKLGDYIPEYIEQSQEYQKAIDKIYEDARKYGLFELTKEQWETVNEYQDKLLDLNKKLLDTITQVEEKATKAIESLGERFGEAEGRFDSYLGVLEHFNDVMELTGLHTKEFATYEALLQQRLDTTSEKINNNKKQFDTYNAALTEAQAMLARAVTQGDQENILFWEEKVRQLERMTEEAYEAFISSWKETVEAATEFFESKVEAIIQSFKDNIFSEGLDNMADKLDKVNDVRERYLDDLTRWYELSKLNRELEKSIDDTDNISAKRRLAEFQKEVLEYQKEGVEMSEYELNHTRARYELLLAEIALEEARNAKNQVQLKRDSEGNWGYVYTADKDAIAEAEQNYEDKLFEMKEAAIEYKEEMESLVIEAMTDMFEELADLDSTAADYQEKAWKIYQFYYEKLGYLAVEFDMALANSNQTLADTVFADEGIMTDFLTYINGIMEEAKEAPAELIKQYEWLQDTIRDANEQAGIDTDNFSGDVIVNIDWVGDKTHDLAQDMNTYTEEIRQSIIKVMQTTQSWKETYLSAIKEMMAANETWNLASYEVPDGYSSWEDYYKDHPSEIDWDWKPTYTGNASGEYRGYMWADVIPVLSSGGGSGGSGGG